MSNKLKVLFAVDFKSGCQFAIKDLLKTAQKVPMEIHLLNVFDAKYFEERKNLFPESAAKLDVAQQEIRTRLEDKLDDWALENMEGVEYSASVNFGRVEDVFSRQSKKYDCLVIGANSHGVIDHIFLNSVAENILGRTFLPTMVLRRNFSSSNEVNVLLDIGEDFKSYILDVFVWAKSMGIKKLNFISYYPVPIEVAAYGINSSLVLPEVEIKKLMNELKNGVEKTLLEYNHSNEIEFTVEIRKALASALSSVITQDMNSSEFPVVIGRKRRSVISEFFLGSVALGILRKAKVDLIILPIED